MAWESTQTIPKRRGRQSVNQMRRVRNGSQNAQSDEKDVIEGLSVQNLVPTQAPDPLPAAVDEKELSVRVSNLLVSYREMRDVFKSLSVDWPSHLLGWCDGVLESPENYTDLVWAYNTLTNEFNNLVSRQKQFFECHKSAHILFDRESSPMVADYLFMEVHLTFWNVYTACLSRQTRLLEAILRQWEIFKQQPSSAEREAHLSKIKAQLMSQENEDEALYQQYVNDYDAYLRSREFLSQQAESSPLRLQLATRLIPDRASDYIKSHSDMDVDTKCDTDDDGNEAALRNANARLKQLISRRAPLAARMDQELDEISGRDSESEDDLSDDSSGADDEDFDVLGDRDGIQPYNMDASDRPETYRDVKSRVLDAVYALKPPETHVTLLMTIRGQIIRHFQNYLAKTKMNDVGYSEQPFLRNMTRLVLGSESLVNEFYDSLDDPWWVATRFFGAHILDEDSYISSLETADSEPLTFFVDSMKQRLQHYELFGRHNDPSLYDMTWLAASLSVILPITTLTGTLFKPRE